VSREYFVVFDAASGDELRRGSGPAGSAALQPGPGEAVAWASAAADLGDPGSLRRDPATGALVARKPEAPS